MAHSREPLTFLVLDVARLLRQRFDRALDKAGIGLTAGEARTLLYVSRSPGLRQTALADWMAIEPMTLVGFIDRLEAAGLVVRGPDPSDRRAKLITPTAAAAAPIERIEGLAQIVRRRAIGKLTAAQEEALRSGLAAIRDGLAAADLAEVA